MLIKQCHNKIQIIHLAPKLGFKTIITERMIQMTTQPIELSQENKRGCFLVLSLPANHHGQYS